MTDTHEGILYHLAPADRWKNWPADLAYLPADFDDDGFVHCTAGDNLMIRVANAFYRSQPGDFVMLLIDPQRLTSPLRWEVSPDALATEFPHVYGPLDRAAIVDVRPVRRSPDGTFEGW